MKRAGQVVLFRFPQADLEKGKLRPALLIAALPGAYDDWLAGMISSQMHHAIPEFDEVLRHDDPDFSASGLKAPSVVRIGRLAVVQGGMLLGAVGEIAPERLQRIKKRLAEWLLQS